jgi:hypothetical protein
VANTAIQAATAAIDEDMWTPVHYPGAVEDPGTGDLISDAEVAETDYTAFAGTRHDITARLVVRRVKGKNPEATCSRCGATTGFSPTPRCPQ